MIAKGSTRVAVVALAAAGSAAFGFPPPSQLPCPAGTQLRRGGELPGLSRHELYCARADGTKHGPTRVFEGGFRTEGSYANGQEVGIWRTWHPNGRLFRRRRLVAGGLDGPEITWEADGTLASKGMWRDGSREGLWIVKDQATGRGNYRHGVREGRWSFSDEGHRAAAGNYRHGELEGAWVFYWPGGGLDSRGTFRHGEKQGRWRFFEPEGWLRVEIQCRGGEADGKFVAYDKHGFVEMRGYFEDGVGGVRRLDGTGRGRSGDLCGDDCWARDHCHTDDEYRLVDDID